MLIPFGQNDKILILGARGNLGGQLARVLGNQYRLLLWDREEVDIADKEELAEKIREHKPDIIINAAAYNAVDKCENDEKEFALAQRLNGEAVGFIADAALAVGARLIHYSTDYVFGGWSYKDGEALKKIKKQGGFSEDYEVCPVNRYAETKHSGEREIVKRGEQGLKYYLIRTSWLFGPKGESELAKPSFFDTMLKLAETRETLDAVDEELGCFTYAPDLALATKELIENKRPDGIYHITNSGQTSWYGAARELFRMARRKVKLNPVSSDKFPRPAKRPKYSVLLNTKIKPLRHYKKALEEYLSIYVNN
ncbi:MAG: dTDP-4-dehydrorhamnose reductase [Candidatus Falkowbacteria bacterium]